MRFGCKAASDVVRKAAASMFVFGGAGVALAAAVAPVPTAGAAPAYYLPWTNGAAYQITQGPGGAVSHNETSTRHHVDFGLPSGTVVRASAPGRVVVSHSENGYGNVVFIDHGGDECTVYGHLSSRSVTVGQQVSQAQQVGLSGSTGYSTGPHLHWGKVRCSSRYTSVAISTVETGGTFAVGSRPVSRNGSSSAPAPLSLSYHDHGGVASEVAMTQVSGGWEMFHIGSNNQIYRKIGRTGQSTGWQLISGPRAKKIAATMSPDGRAELFYIGMDNAIYHHGEATPGGDLSRWESLGGWATSIAAARAGSRGWEVFHIGGGNQIFRQTQWNRSPQAMPGTWATEVAAATHPDGRVELFHIGGGSKIFHAWQSAVGESYGGWRDYGGVASQIAATQVGGGWEMYHVGTTGMIYRRTDRQGQYQAIAGTWAKDIAVAMSPDGRVELLHIASGSNILHAWQKSPGVF